jgi:hypothetical protein
MMLMGPRSRLSPMTVDPAGSTMESPPAVLEFSQYFSAGELFRAEGTTESQ